MTMTEFVALANESANTETIDDTKFMALASRANISSLMAKFIKATKEVAALKIEAENNRMLLREAEFIVTKYFNGFDLLMRAYLDKDAHAQEEAVKMLQDYRNEEIKL